MPLPLNLWLDAAALGAAAILLIHVVLGGRDHHRPMQASPIPEPDKAVWSVLWHLTSALLGLMTASLWAAARGRAELAFLPLGVALSFTALFLTESLRRFGSPWALPQWTLFALLSALIGAGLYLPPR